MAAHEKGTITIIGGPPPVTGRGGGEYVPLPQTGPEEEEHALWPFSTKKPVKELTEQIEEIKAEVAEIVKSLAKVVADNAELEQVTIGLALSIQGSIGIASAGAEAAIQLSYKIKR